jgi:hypothetical protein
VEGKICSLCKEIDILGMMQNSEKECKYLSGQAINLGTSATLRFPSQCSQCMVLRDLIPSKPTGLFAGLALIPINNLQYIEPDIDADCDRILDDRPGRLRSYTSYLHIVQEAAVATKK